MTTSKKKGIKTILSVFILLFVSYGGYSLISSKITNNTEILSDKKLILNKLKETSLAYDTAIKESKVKDVHLEEAKLKIDHLIDSLQTSNATVKDLLLLKEKQLELSSEMKNLIRDNKELIQDNKILVHSLQKRKTQLSNSEAISTELKKENEALQAEKNLLHNSIEEAKYLTLLDLEIAGIKERSSGKEMTTNKAKRVNKLKICYAIAKNTLVQEGDKTMQVQILDPNNELVTQNTGALQIAESNILYSFNTTFSYKNENLNVCDYFVFNADTTLEKGTYQIHIYDNKNVVTSSTIALK
ncbi:hypothetical protein ACFSSB_11400 [Lacinutrix gracilariae]|uniref:Uncharacterized protein n=1 Tax=Lacinutrix gracilariae TaxID=1747198 RepID=A0ABW5K268_9FLAO